MPSHKVHRSVAHNQAQSFISVMNYRGDGYVPCHLLRASRKSGIDELEVDLLNDRAGPPALLVPAVAGSIADYRYNFERLVVSGGAAMEMVRTATMTVRVLHGRVVGDRAGRLFHARLNATVSIVDDRGISHVGEHVEEWPCEQQAQSKLQRFLGRLRFRLRI
jgi:hypothetical protein